MKGVIVGGFVLIAAFVFWLAFWVIAPFAASLIPASDWKPFIDFIIYAIVAWGGGIGLPIALVFAGVGIALSLD